MALSEPPKDKALDRFEEQLRRLRPVAPRALTIPHRSAPRRALAFATIALLVIALKMLQWRSTGPKEVGKAGSNQLAVLPNHAVARPITLGELNAALRTSDHDLNQLLEDASPRLLPRGHRGTALFELGKE